MARALLGQADHGRGDVILVAVVVVLQAGQAEPPGVLVDMGRTSAFECPAKWPFAYSALAAARCLASWTGIAPGKGNTGLGELVPLGLGDG